MSSRRNFSPKPSCSTAERSCAIAATNREIQEAYFFQWTKWLALAVPLLALLATDALAHEDDEIEEIVVSGRWDRPNGLTISASQGYIAQADFEQRPRLRPGDILEVVPGLIVTQHSGSGKSNQMFLRGFNLDHGTDFATSIDGMPINMPTHGHGQGYTDLNFIIPELVENLEFRKGPYYSNVGDFSSAGAAMFSTTDRLETGLIKAGLGEDGFGEVLLADSFSTRRGDLLVGLQSGRYDGPWSGVEEDLEKYNGLFKYSESIPDQHEWSITLMGYDAQWDSADQIPQRAVEAGTVSRLGTIDETVGGDTSRYSLSGRWHKDIGEQQLTARAYVIDYELSLFSNFTYFLEDQDNGDQFEQVDDRRIYGGDLTWRRLVGEDTQHTWGASLRYDVIDEVGLYNTAQRNRLNTVREDEVDELSTGLYYDIEHVWNERWRSTFGVRADYFYFDVEQSNIVENEGSETDWILSPKLNVIRTLSDTTEAYFSAGSAYHSNDARGTVISRDPATGDAAESVDPLVRSKGAELGMRYFVRDRLNVSAAIWILELDSELLFVGDAGNTEASRESRRYGIEIPAYYRLNERLLLDFEIALTRSRFRDSDPSGDRIPGSLSRVIAAGATTNLENGGYGTLRVRHFGDRPLIEDGSVRSGSSTVWNMGLGYKTEQLDFRLEVLNLFDSDSDDITYFYESRLPGEPAQGIADVHFHPIEPRTFRAYVTWRRAQ